MKFTDGNWLLREGVQAFYAVEARDIAISDDTLTLYAPTRRIIHRGDTLTGPLLTIELSCARFDDEAVAELLLALLVVVVLAAGAVVTAVVFVVAVVAVVAVGAVGSFSVGRLFAAMAL